VKYRFLLAALLGLILTLPLETEHIKNMLGLFGGIVPLSGGRLGQKGWLVPLLASMTVLLSLHELADVQWVPRWVSVGMLCLYFWAAASLVLRQVFRHRCSTPELLSGALSCYLLLGLGWTAAFSLLEHVQPGALRSPHPLDSCAYLYFTFITLLTIGYGDIVPESSAARIMVVLTGISGMVFTTVVLASLVTMQTSKQGENA